MKKSGKRKPQEETNVRNTSRGFPHFAAAPFSAGRRARALRLLDFQSHRPFAPVRDDVRHFAGEAFEALRRVVGHGECGDDRVIIHGARQGAEGRFGERDRVADRHQSFAGHAEIHFPDHGVHLRAHHTTGLFVRQTENQGREDIEIFAQTGYTFIRR